MIYYYYYVQHVGLFLQPPSLVEGRLGVDPLDMPRTPYRANKEKPVEDSSSSSKSLLLSC